MTTAESDEGIALTGACCCHPSSPSMGSVVQLLLSLGVRESSHGRGRVGALQLPRCAVTASWCEVLLAAGGRPEVLGHL